MRPGSSCNTAVHYAMKSRDASTHHHTPKAQVQSAQRQAADREVSLCKPSLMFVALVVLPSIVFQNGNPACPSQYFVVLQSRSRQSGGSKRSNLCDVNFQVLIFLDTTLQLRSHCLSPSTAACHIIGRDQHCDAYSWTPCAHGVTITSPAGVPISSVYTSVFSLGQKPCGRLRRQPV